MDGLWTPSLPDQIARANLLYRNGHVALARDAYLQAAGLARCADWIDVESEMLQAACYCNEIVHGRTPRESWA